VASVFTPITSGLLPSLKHGFVQDSGFDLQLDAMNDVFGPGLTGEVDMIICHYGHVGVPGRLPGQEEGDEQEASSGFGHGHPPSGYGPGHPPPGYGPGHPPPNGPRAAATATGAAATRRYDVERFVSEGYGLWPRALFANQAVLLGPDDDPARVHGLTDAAEALKRIADSKADLLVSDDVRILYILETLAEASGIHRGSWYVHTDAGGTELIAAAAKRKAYTMWGDVSSLTEVPGLRRMVVADPILQREIMGIVVNPSKVSGVNASGAEKYLRYLLTPAAQAKVRNFRSGSGATERWWPVGVANPETFLPVTTEL
jgi:ABC-type tungstate transport system permease subunit